MEQLRGSTPAPATRQDASSWRAKILVLLCLAAVGWVAYIGDCGRCGLYEDDYYIVGFPMSWSRHDFANNLIMYLTVWPQGRPVGVPLAQTMSWIGYRLGGFPFVYFIAFLWITLNSFLLYTLLRRRFSEEASLAGALMFCLFPADTGKMLLSTALLVQPSLTYLLLAAHCYLRGRRTLSYFLVLGCAVGYETTFMPFFAVPLLEGPWSRDTAKKFLRHAAVLVAILVCVLALRKVLGEARVESLTADFADAVRRVLTSMVVGPLTTLRLCLVRAAQLFRFPQASLVAIMAGALGGLFWLFSRLGGDRPGSVEAAQSGPSGTAQRRRLREAGWFALGSLAALVFAYGLTFTYPYSPPKIETGRQTIVHVAATFGVSLLCGALCAAAVLLAKSTAMKALVRLLLAGYFSLLIGFQTTVQWDFRSAWHFQQYFWTAVLKECPDLTEGTVIFYEAEHLPLAYILANSWADALVLEQIFLFPWQFKARLFSVPKSWREQVVVKDNLLLWPNPANLAVPPLQQHQVILLRGRLGEINLTRITGNISIQGIELQLKERGQSTLSSFHKGPLYDHLTPGARQ